jgi:hypothetical protein
MLYTIGCSFTYAQQRGWPTMLTEKIKARTGADITLANNGHPGAGNLYISDKLILDSYNPKYAKPDLVVVMWSGLTRKDIVVDHKDTDVMNALEGYGFVRWTGFQTSYVLSGGIVGSWLNHPTTKEMFAPLYKMSNRRTMAQDTLVNIIKLQNYLKINNIPYIMSSYVNYWKDEDRVADLDYGIEQFHDLKYLVNQIDFDRWAFINDQKDGIYELAKQTPNGIQEDGWHPDFNVHELWTDILMSKLEADQFFK